MCDVSCRTSSAFMEFSRRFAVALVGAALPMEADRLRSRRKGRIRRIAAPAFRSAIPSSRRHQLPLPHLLYYAIDQFDNKLSWAIALE